MRAPWALVLALAGCSSGHAADAIDRDGTKACVSNAEAPTTRVRRLTKGELESTFGALLGERAEQALANVDADPQLNGHYSNNDELVASTSFLSGLHLSVDSAAGQFKDTITNATYDAACFASESGAEACAQSFIRSFGTRAYRRALRDDEVAALMPVYSAGRELGVDGDAADRFRVGLTWVVRAMLQAPELLYISELGAPSVTNGASTRLLPEEVASALAFSVVGMPPDETLSALAAADRLATPADRVAQAARLIDQYPDGWRKQLRTFVTEWLGIHFGSPEWNKDATAVPLFSPALKDAFETELQLWLDEWATEPEGPELSRLLTGTSTFVNQINAPIYGVSAPGMEFRKVSLDGTQRAGILTLGAFLGSTSHVAETSPVLRGKVILQRLLCREPPTPPAKLPPLPPPDASAPTTTRARYEAHLVNDACRGCHLLFEPMGNAFEGYDVIGQFRSEQHGFPVDSSGALVAADGSQTPVSGAVELVQRLADSAEVRACAARQLFRFTLGRQEGAYDSCAIEAATRILTTGSGSLRDVVLSIVGSDAFVLRTVQQ